MYNLYIRDKFDTLQLQSNGCEVMDYTMRGPRPARRDQASRVSAEPPDYEDVSETLRLMVTEATQARVQDKTRRLEAFLERARLNSRRRPEDAVYLYIQFDEDNWLWRSELLSGELSAENPLDSLWKLHTPVSITFTRRYYWEMAEANPVKLAISANGQSASTAGRTVIFGQNSWIHIAANQVPGSLPAPLKLEIRNNSGNGQFMTQTWLINNAHATPPTISVVRTAGQMTEPGSNRWLLPSNLVNACKGRYVRALLHHTSGGITGTAQGLLEVSDVSGSSFFTAWRGQVVERQGITDLGVFPLPPGAESGGYGDLYFRAITAWPVDHVKLIPVSSERRVAVMDSALGSGLGFADGEALVDDGILGESYAQYDTGIKTPMVIGRGEPLWVWPGIAQRVHIVWAGFSYGYRPTYTAEVHAWVRPRRGTI